MMTDAQFQENPKPNPYNVAPPQNYNQWNAPSPAYLAPNPLNSNPGQVPPPAYYNQPGPSSTSVNHINLQLGHSPPPPIIYQINPQYQGDVCQFCKKSAGRRAIPEMGQTQILWCVLIFFFLPICCCIPCCMSSCDDIRYQCNSCNSIVGHYHKPFCS